MERQTNQEINSYIIQSQEEEIKRIAHELHEGVGQTLYSVYTGLQLIEKNLEHEEMKSYVDELSQLLEKTIQEVRLLSVELHPPTLTTLGFTSALKSYLKLYTSTYGILVDFQQIGEEKNIIERKRISLFRVCQEALGNIAKYADTLQVEVKLVWNENTLRVFINDFGKGFDVKKELKYSTGLAAMQERIYRIGGTCSISSIIGQGTTVEIKLPLSESSFL